MLNSRLWFLRLVLGVLLVIVGMPGISPAAETPGYRVGIVTYDLNTTLRADVFNDVVRIMEGQVENYYGEKIVFSTLKEDRRSFLEQIEMSGEHFAKNYLKRNNLDVVIFASIDTTGEGMTVKRFDPSGVMEPTYLPFFQNNRNEISTLMASVYMNIINVVDKSYFSKRRY